MSLVVAIRFKGGVVLAGDSRETGPEGRYRDDARKVFKLTEHIAVGCAGNTALYEEIMVRLEKRLADRQEMFLSNAIVEITEVAQDTHSRFAKMHGDKDPFLRNPVEAILIGYEAEGQPAPVIIGCTTKSSYEPKEARKDRPLAVMGEPRHVKHILRWCADGELSREQAMFLSALAIVETARTTNIVGGPIRVLLIENGVVSEADDAQAKKALEDAGKVNWKRLLLS